MIICLLSWETDCIENSSNSDSSIRVCIPCGTNETTEPLPNNDSMDTNGGTD
jgi:hypothetical protein